MELTEQVLFFFCALGVFNGLLMVIYFLCFIRPNKLANILFACLLLMLCIRIGKSSFYIFNTNLPFFYRQFGLSACIFIGPFLFFYIKTILDKKNIIDLSFKLQLGGLTLIILGVGSLYPYQHFPNFWNQYMVALIYFVWLTYLLITAFLLRKHFIKAFTNFSNLSPLDQWLLLVFFTNAFICGAYCAVYFFKFSNFYITGPLSFSLIFYVLLTFLILQKDRSAIFLNAPEKYLDKKINQEHATKLLAQLRQLMEKEQLYTNSKLKLGMVAEQINVPSHQLSQLLNDNLGKNFSRFINEYRIEAACKMILHNENLSLEGIGFEVGFNSKSTFFATFKKIKEVTPAQFKSKLLKK